MAEEYNSGSCVVNNPGSLTAENCGFMFWRMKYGERLRAARNHAELTQRGLADKIGNVCSQENISKLERGDATGSEFTAQFADACGVRAIWLASEKGQMVAAPTLDRYPEPILKILKAAENMDTAEQYLALRIIESLPKPEQNDKGD